MAYPFTADGIQQFLTYLQAKGLVNPNSIGGIKTSCDKVFSALDADERNNIANLDPVQAVQRFMNKNPGVLSPDSAGVYQSRVQRALRMLTDFNANPTGFKVQGAKKQNGDITTDKKVNLSKKAVSSKENVTAFKPHDISPPHSSAMMPVSNSVSLSFPLRAEFMAQFILPKDLTNKEAKKLAAYLAVLAIDFDPD